MSDDVAASTLDDVVLVAQAIDGDQEAFTQLVVRWERPIFALAYRTLGREEEARDVCQETFLRAYRSLEGFRGQAKFSSWIYRIALNLCRDRMRKERRAVLVPASEEFEDRVDRMEAPVRETAEDLVVRRDLGRVVERLMIALPADQRTAIVLKEYHGLTFQEIADLQECPVSTVKTRLYQGLSVLRRQLDEWGVRRVSAVAASGGPLPRFARGR